MNYNSDPVFQSIQQIRTPAAIEPILIQTWAHWLGKQPQSIELTPTLTYYRPFDRARITADMTVNLENGVEPIKLHLFFNVFADAEIANQQVEQAYELAVPPSVALPVFAIADWQTVVWTLPTLPVCPNLPHSCNQNTFVRCSSLLAISLRKQRIILLLNYFAMFPSNVPFNLGQSQ